MIGTGVRIMVAEVRVNDANSVFALHLPVVSKRALPGSVYMQS